jgi:hypothetical protein
LNKLCSGGEDIDICIDFLTKLLFPALALAGAKIASHVVCNRNSSAVMLMQCTKHTFRIGFEAISGVQKASNYIQYETKLAYRLRLTFQRSMTMRMRHRYVEIERLALIRRSTRTLSSSSFDRHRSIEPQ